MTEEQVAPEHYMTREKPRKAGRPKLTAVGPICTACNADVGMRRIAETLIRMNVSIRDVADFSDWWAQKNGQKSVTRSAWGRHKLNGHMSFSDRKATEDHDIQSLQDMVADMFRRFQAGRKDYIPSSQEMRDWLSLEARIADLQQRRQDERELRALAAGLAYSPPKAIEAQVRVIENGAAESEETMREPTKE